MGQIPEFESSLPQAVRAHVARALAEDSTWRRVDLLLEALILECDDVPYAIAQCSLWHLPESGEIQMQRIRGRYLARPDTHDWDAQALGSLFATDMREWADPGVPAVHRAIAEARDHDVIADYRQIIPTHVWEQLAISRQGSRRLGFFTGFTHYWRIDPLQCMNTTVWPGDRPEGLDPDARQRVGDLFRLAQPLLEKAFMADAIGQVIHGLTARQRDVLRQVLAGFSEKQMARRMHRSEHTIHSHVSELYRQFNVQSRAELMARFIDEAVVEPHMQDGWL